MKCYYQSMQITKLALIAAATFGTAGTFGATIALPAAAHADSQYFQSPSENIVCTLDSAGAACDIKEYTYQPPPPPECAKHIKWGNRFTLAPGTPGALACHGDTLRVAGEQTLNYGQTISAGSITCASDLSGMKCTDTSSGHYFQVSKDSYNLG
jgi:hypothetical protein